MLYTHCMSCSVLMHKARYKLIGIHKNEVMSNSRGNQSHLCHSINVEMGSTVDGQPSTIPIVANPLIPVDDGVRTSMVWSTHAASHPSSDHSVSSASVIRPVNIGPRGIVRPEDRTPNDEVEHDQDSDQAVGRLVGAVAVPRHSTFNIAGRASRPESWANEQRRLFCRRQSGVFGR